MKEALARWAIAVSLMALLGVLVTASPAWADCFCQGNWLNNCDICYECSGDSCQTSGWCEDQCTENSTCDDQGCVTRRCRTLPDGSTLCDP